MVKFAKAMERREVENNWSEPIMVEKTTAKLSRLTKAILVLVAATIANMVALPVWGEAYWYVSSSGEELMEVLADINVYGAVICGCAALGCILAKIFLTVAEAVVKKLNK